MEEEKEENKEDIIEGKSNTLEIINISLIVINAIWLLLKDFCHDSIIPLLIGMMIIFYALSLALKIACEKRVFRNISNVIIAITIILNIIVFNYWIYERSNSAYDHLGGGSIDKPIIYIYPNEDIDVSVKLLNSDNITISYPKYDNEWNARVLKDGTIINNNKEYYSLYYEAKSTLNNSIDYNSGFVVAKDQIELFLEEKLELLGLNYKEREEFIIYWLPKLKENKYNYIRFQTVEEINENMPIYITPTPDTFIRIIMEYKGLNEKINVKEQALNKVNRNGYTVVEWGGSEIK